VGEIPRREILPGLPASLGWEQSSGDTQ
jgi:hypothetical protein